MTAKFKLLIIGLLLMCLSFTAIINYYLNSRIEYIESLSKRNYVFKIDNLHNGDAKFYSENFILTNVGGKLTVITSDGSILKKFDDINVNWLSVEQNDKTIVYGNRNNELGVLKLDDSFNVTFNEIIKTSDNLQIDPTIIKIDGTYYITATEIEGNVNNADPNIENGLYTVKLYTSENLTDFQYKGDIISDNHNIEDLVPFFINNKYYLFFEREVSDKQNSSIEAIFSDDNGSSWSEPKILCEANADNELGNMLYKNKTFIMLYSSDFLNPKTSYEGASIYVTYFNRDLEQTSGCAIIEPFSSALLYDVIESNNSIYLLYTEKYMTESNLILAELKK